MQTKSLIKCMARAVSYIWVCHWNLEKYMTFGADQYGSLDCNICFSKNNRYLHLPLSVDMTKTPPLTKL